MPKIATQTHCYYGITDLSMIRPKWDNQGMNYWHRYNPNPLENRVEDCVQRAISAALDVDWDTASDMVHDMAKSMGLPEHTDAAWGAILRRNGFYRAIIPNTCPDCYTVADFCREHPHGVYVLKTTGHVVTVIDGQVWDTWDSTGEIPIYFFYRRYE